MCRLAYTPGECCCLFSRATGVKLIGMLNAVLFFFSMFSPIVQDVETSERLPKMIDNTTLICPLLNLDSLDSVHKPLLLKYLQKTSIQLLIMLSR